MLIMNYDPTSPAHRKVGNYEQAIKSQQVIDWFFKQGTRRHLIVAYRLQALQKVKPVIVDDHINPYPLTGRAKQAYDDFIKKPIHKIEKPSFVSMRLHEALLSERAAYSFNASTRTIILSETTNYPVKQCTTCNAFQYENELIRSPFGDLMCDSCIAQL